MRGTRRVAGGTSRRSGQRGDKSKVGVICRTLTSPSLRESAHFASKSRYFYVWLSKTCAAWADALRIAIGSATRTGCRAGGSPLRQLGARRPASPFTDAIYTKRLTVRAGRPRSRPHPFGERRRRLRPA